jgi:hypothetical protein
MLICTPAWGDAVGARAKQLRESGEYKVRLSAALWLGKKRDKRAVAAIAYALKNDRERTVRSVAALSLGKLIDESLPAKVRDRAIDVLEHSAKNDSDKKVREKARAAWVQTKALRTPKGGLPPVFVAVGAPTAKNKKLASSGTKAAMQLAMRRALRESAPDFGQSTKGDGLPTKKALRKARSAGFFVNASVGSVKVLKRGGVAEVRCEVSMHVNPWTGSDGQESFREKEAASASGKGRVKGANTSKAISNARRDCIIAVVEEITARQIVPFVKRSADRRIAQQRK